MSDECGRRLRSGELCRKPAVTKRLATILLNPTRLEYATYAVDVCDEHKVEYDKDENPIGIRNF